MTLLTRLGEPLAFTTDYFASAIKPIMERAGSFGSIQQAQLAGIAAVPAAREMLMGRIQSLWWSAPPPDELPEIVIGAGLHAAVYCAARYAATGQRPVVLERSTWPGGAFAMSKKPAFYLNSRNRPGMIGLPGRGEALNYLPGAILQPAELSLAEFQDNTELAYCIRLMLAEYANVHIGRAVRSAGASPRNGNYTQRLQLEDGRKLWARRVIDARGLGDASLPAGVKADGQRLLTFGQFMAAMDTSFPMAGMRRVAVIGDGDSAKCAIETLAGQGPPPQLSCAALDYVPEIDWYAPDLPADCRQWRATQRGRYQLIASLLRRASFGPDARVPVRARVSVINERGEVTPSMDSVIVNGRSYDHVIMATGYQLPRLGIGEYRAVGSSPVIARVSTLGAASVYAIGPAAGMGFTQAERDAGLARVAENQVAMFRLANRTAALAQLLSRTDERR